MRVWHVSFSAHSMAWEPSYGQKQFFLTHFSKIRVSYFLETQLLIFEKRRFWEKWQYLKFLQCICQSATTKVTVWAVRSFHVFGKKWFCDCNYQSNSTFWGVPPFSNYCNIELILFVQTEDNTSYFLRIQYFLFSQKQNSWGWGNQAPEPGGTSWQTPGEPPRASSGHCPLSYWVRTLLGKPS